MAVAAADITLVIAVRGIYDAVLPEGAVWLGDGISEPLWGIGDVEEVGQNGLRLIGSGLSFSAFGLPGAHPPKVGSLGARAAASRRLTASR